MADNLEMQPINDNTAKRRAVGAFTIVELMVTMAMLTMTAGMVFPMLNRTRAKTTLAQCLGNQKQIGSALHQYLEDHDGLLPGPCWEGVQAAYRKDADQLVRYLATYVHAQKPGERREVANAFVCPLFMKNVQGVESVQDLEGRTVALLNNGIRVPQGKVIQPFGYPPFRGVPEQQPMKLSTVAACGPLSERWLMADVDHLNVSDNTVSWYNDIPDKPVHGAVRPTLYFDGHTASSPVVP